MQKLQDLISSISNEIEECHDGTVLTEKLRAGAARLQDAAAAIKKELEECDEKCLQARYHTSGLYNDVARKLCLRGMNYEGTLKEAGASLEKLQQLLKEQQVLEEKDAAVQQALSRIQERLQEQQAKAAAGSLNPPL